MAANTEPGFFRLILLSRGRWDDGIHCTLRPFNRFQDGYPPYKALSYVWGRWSRNSPEILVDGRKVRVTTNLAIALRHLRHEEVNMALWIDALCIDQSNTEERSSQVAQMRDIYGTAAEVIIFLGNGLESGVARSHSSRDLRPFHRFGGCEPDLLLARQYIDAWKTSPLKTPVQPLEIFAFLTIMSWSWQSSNPLDTLEDIPEAHMAALAEALRRTLLVPWWDRIWVVQEAVVAQRLIVRYGNVAVPWELLVAAADVLSGWESVHAKFPSSISTTELKVFNLFSRVSNLNHFRREWTRSQGTNLLLLLRYFGFRRASDERDRVYALLGLCNEATIFRPDYSLQTAEVYMAPVLLTIRNTKSLSVLYGDHSRKGRQDIPSWVPDWSTEREENERRRIELSTLYDACKGVRPRLITKNASLQDVIRGDMLSLLGILQAEHDPKRLLKEEYALRFRASEHGVYHTSPVNEELEQVCEDLMAYCHKDGLRELPRYSFIEQRKHSLKIVGRKVGTVSQATEPLYAPVTQSTAAEVLIRWASLATTKPTEDRGEGFLKTIVSDVIKPPNKPSRRLQAGDSELLERWISSGQSQNQARITADDDSDQFTEVMQLSTTKRTMFYIDNDPSFSMQCEYIGMGPLLMKQGDEVYVLPGSRVPLVLRPENCCENNTCSHIIRRYQLIGDCFIHNAMDGERTSTGRDILEIIASGHYEGSWNAFHRNRLSHGEHIWFNRTHGAPRGGLVALEII
ncbi:heterokaryon incompatibility protein domain-containing protein [Trichoderma novae-zelandiae]